MLARVAVIGGTGFSTLSEVDKTECVKTDYGDVELSYSKRGDSMFVFLCRHGDHHSIPPHRINYRANIAALSSIGVEHVIATNAVGGIADGAGPGNFIIPDQLIDYTTGRASTFYDDFTDAPLHIDFTYPFDGKVRDALLQSTSEGGNAYLDTGVYGCVQGPRLETAAEVQKYKSDGCSVLGMTAMPEAALARELGLDYATICFSVNWAAGISSPIKMDDIFKQITISSIKLKPILLRTIDFLHQSSDTLIRI